MNAWTPPFLRWAGSKRTLLPHLVPLVPLSGGRYIEPFAGSACLFFATRPRAAVIADLNRELIETYRVLRRHPRRLTRALYGLPTDRDTYYKVRALEATSLGTIDRAARFIYLNRLCFNGVYRTNRLGRFNVPYGARTGALPTESHLLRCSVALRDADLRDGDFEQTTADAREGDFVYLDPPYAQNPKQAYGVYGYGSFDAGELGRIFELLRRLDRAGVTFLFSYAALPELGPQLASNWTVEQVVANGRVAASVASRAARQELIITNGRGIHPNP